jgi:hypothetical protein
VRAVGELVVLLAVVGFVVVLAGAVAARLRPQPPRWRVDTRVLPDGTLRVVVCRGPDEERLVRELASGLDPTELAAELRLAREDAELIAGELNRGRP